MKFSDKTKTLKFISYEIVFLGPKNVIFMFLKDAGIHSVMGILMICVSTIFLLVIEENDRMCYRDACFENHAFRILCGVSFYKIYTEKVE